MSYQICAKCDRCGAPTYWVDGWASALPQPVTYICKCYDAPARPNLLAQLGTSSTPPAIAFPGTLRDWFAGMALQGLLARPRSSDDEYTVEMAAEDSWAYANALLAQRTGGGR